MPRLNVFPLTGTPSPQHPGYWRESASFSFDDWQAAKTVWIDVPVDRQTTTATHANHWLVCCFLIAYELRADIHVEGAVDQLLARNLQGINLIFNGWFKTEHVVRVSAKEITRMQRTQEQRRGLFFSGGVDSMFSLFDAEESGPDRHISELLCVWGFDIPLSLPAEFAKLRHSLEVIATATGKRFTPVITNLRNMGEPYEHHWGSKGHGAALAAIAHMMSPVFSEVRIASSFDYSNLFPWGSHPFVDPLYSGTNLLLIHDGAAWTRVEKTMLVAQHDLALASLHVCSGTDAAHNCSRCSKCTRTMLTLDILGAKDRATTFDWSDYAVDTLPPHLLSNWLDRAFFDEIRRTAHERGRIDVENYLAKCYRYSRWMRPIPRRFLKWSPVQRYSRFIKSLLR